MRSRHLRLNNSMAFAAYLIGGFALLSLSACAPSSKPDAHKLSNPARAAAAKLAMLQRQAQLRQELAAQQHQQQLQSQQHGQTTPPAKTAQSTTPPPANGQPSAQTPPAASPSAKHEARIVKSSQQQNGPYCRATNIVPKQITEYAGEVYQKEKICQSYAVTVTSSGINLPANNLQVQDTHLALLPSDVSNQSLSGGTYSTFVFKSPTLKTTPHQLVLTYILPGVDPKNLVRNQQPTLTVAVQAKTITTNNGEIVLQPGSDYQLESISATLKGQKENMTIVHIIRPSLFTTINPDYTLDVQLPSSLVTNPSLANGFQNSTATEPVSIADAEVSIVPAASATASTPAASASATHIAATVTPKSKPTVNPQNTVTFDPCQTGYELDRQSSPQKCVQIPTVANLPTVVITNGPKNNPAQEAAAAAAALIAQPQTQTLSADINH